MTEKRIVRVVLSLEDPPAELLYRLSSKIKAQPGYWQESIDFLEFELESVVEIREQTR
jgi:hypothetical protein